MNGYNCPLIPGSQCNIPQIKAMFDEADMPCYLESSCIPCQIPAIQNAISGHYDTGREKVVIPGDIMLRLKQFVQLWCPFLEHHCDIGTPENCQMPNCITKCTSQLRVGKCTICGLSDLPLRERPDGKWACIICQ